MTPAEIQSALLAQLQDSSNLSYISDNNIMEGVRDRITIFPCIIIEPSELAESDFAYPKQRLTLSLSIIGYIEVHDKDKQFVGDTNTKGIYDLENDIKKALDEDRTIDGDAINLTIRNSVYDFVNYPVRSVTINIDILLEQTKGTR